MIAWIKDFWADIKAWWNADAFVQPTPPVDIIPDDKPTPISPKPKRSVKKK